MRIPALTTSFALALALAACGSNAGDDANNVALEANATDDAAANSALGANEAALGAPTDANGFVTNVAASDLFEIESGKLAQSKGSSADIKAFGAKLVTDHTKSSADLKTAASTASPAVTVNPALDAEKQAMLDQLKAASGADFDTKFAEQQATAHQKALTLLQGYAGSGDQQSLKDFATKATPVVQAHLDHVKTLAK